MAAPEIGILALIEAKPGKGPDLHALLKIGARGWRSPSRARSTGLPSRSATTTYGIFDTFDSTRTRGSRTSTARSPRPWPAHGDEILAKEPDIQTVDIVAVK